MLFVPSRLAGAIAFTVGFLLVAIACYVLYMLNKLRRDVRILEMKCKEAENKDMFIVLDEAIDALREFSADKTTEQQRQAYRLYIEVTEWLCLYFSNKHNTV
jgi:hypothetical protein